jgi:carbamate kinase
MEASKLRQKKNWTNINDSGRGYRRVVPSPDPKSIVESFAVKQLFSAGVLVIACGGGGIPVVLRGEDGTFEGVEAVIDKDHTAATLATNIGAEVLLILTDVDRVFLNYGKPDQKEIARMTLEEAKRYLAEGHFAPGSMRPKIESAIKFVESGGEKTIITSIEKAKEALEGKAGTVVA